jgi:hypothetical protein
MATKDKAAPTVRDIVTRLIEAAKGDTLCWDLHLRRAAVHLAPVFSRDLYQLLRHGDTAVAEAMRAGSRALNRNDWKEVKEMAAKARDLRRAQAERTADMKLGEMVYEVAEVPVDPFSPGFDQLLGGSLEALKAKRDKLVGVLRELEQMDPAEGAFYAGRRAELEKLPLSLQEIRVAEGAPDPSALRREAAMLLDRGDLDQLARIADEIMAAEKAARAPALSEGPQRKVPAAPSRRAARSRETAPRVPEDAVSKALKLGFALDFHEPNIEVADFIARNAWYPTFSGEGLSVAGPRASEDPETLAFMRDAPEAMRGPLREIFARFALHPYVTSGGTRYLPRLDGEWLLVEDFSETKVPDGPSPLLDALNLPRRRGLARSTIEQALLDRGANVVEESLGLDPRAYRMICIPVDAYTNLGQRRGWGAQACWTHFDGYQVLPKGGQRALVGGDVRFGGLLDLCSISRLDEREGMILRLAVVQRERMAVARA